MPVLYIFIYKYMYNVVRICTYNYTSQIFQMMMAKALNLSPPPSQLSYILFICIHRLMVLRATQSFEYHRRERHLCINV